MADNINMRHLSIFLLYLVLVFSCTRSNNSETTKVQIALPSAASSSKSSSPILQSKNLKSGSVGIAALPVANVELGISADEETYTDILPSGVTTGSYPINCYLVAAEGPEVNMQNNYCGLKNSDLEIQKTYKFGTFVGLRKSGDSLTIEVPTGKDRVFHVFGIYALDENECKDLSNDPNKRMLSYPYHLGTSQPTNLEGRDVDVVISLSNPTESMRVDDCNLNAPVVQKELANFITMGTRSFPYNAATKPITAGHTCEPLSFSLISNRNTLNFGALSEDTLYQLTLTDLNTSAKAPRDVYDSYSECALDLNAKSEFTIKKDRVSTGVWVRLVASDNANTQFDAIARSSVAESLPVSLRLSNTPVADIALDTNLPRRVAPEVCYPFTVYSKRVQGTPANLTTNRDIAVRVKSVPDGTSVAALIYTSLSDCSTSSVSTTSEVTIGASTIESAGPTYIKFNKPSDIESAAIIQLRPNGGSDTIFDTDIPLKYVEKAASSPKITRLEIRGPTNVLTPNVNCFPIELSLIDQLGAPFVPASSGFYSIDSTATSSGLTFYNEPTCSINPFTSFSAYQANTLSKVIYVRIAPNAGLKAISIKADLVISATYIFRVKE